MKTSWTPADLDSQAGKRILVTGANSGIGYYAALELARHGASVILACRDLSRAHQALARIRAEVAGADAEVAMLDLASLESIRHFAQAELARMRPLDVLINNAGVMAPPRRLETADGFEVQFGTNVLGHFALTAWLMPALERAASASATAPRIVTIASVAHKRGRLDFADLQSTRHYSPMRSYQQSKLADLMFAFELDRRLRAHGSRLMSVAAHPGVANTNLFQGGDRPAVEIAIRKLAGCVIGAVLNTDRAGALPTVYAAASAAAQPGGYYGPQGFMEIRGATVGAAKVSPQANDLDAADRLWRVCEAATGQSMLEIAGQPGRMERGA